MEVATVLSTNEDFLWQSCLSALETRLTKPIFETWIKPMRVQRMTTDEITLTVQNAFAKDWAENRLKSTILGTLTDIMGAPMNVRFIIEEGEVQNSGHLAAASEAPVQAPAVSEEFRHTGLT